MNRVLLRLGCFLLLVSPIIAFNGCNKITGKKVEVKEEISSKNSGGPTLDYRHSPILYQPMYIQDDSMWQTIQQVIGRKLKKVDFSKDTVVGCFAFEPDKPELDENGTFKDRGYGVRLKSVTVDGNNHYTVRFQQDSTRGNPSLARGPLHYYFGIIEGTLKDPVYYVNGEKVEMNFKQIIDDQNSFIKQ